MTLEPSGKTLIHESDIVYKPFHQASFKKKKPHNILDANLSYVSR